MIAYHDTEWGVPEYDSRALWEKLVLDGFQAGLAWITVLRKREAFRSAFRGFNPEEIARFNEADIEPLLADPRIIRSRAKIQAAIGNARAYLEMREAGQEFSSTVWALANRAPVRSHGPVPVKSAASEEISQYLKSRGFKFVGPVIVYAWMQAVGMVNDHSPECFRRNAGVPG